MTYKLIYRSEIYVYSVISNSWIGIYLDRHSRRHRFLMISKISMTTMFANELNAAFTRLYRIYSRYRCELLQMIRMQRFCQVHLEVRQVDTLVDKRLRRDGQFHFNSNYFNPIYPSNIIYFWIFFSKYKNDFFVIINRFILTFNHYKDKYLSPCQLKSIYFNLSSLNRYTITIWIRPRLN